MIDKSINSIRQRDGSGQQKTLDYFTAPIGNPVIGIQEKGKAPKKAKPPTSPFLRHLPQMALTKSSLWSTALAIMFGRMKVAKISIGGGEQESSKKREKNLESRLF